MNPEPTVTLTARRVFELSGPTGSLGLFECVSEWEGYRRLESLAQPKQSIIVDDSQGGGLSRFWALLGASGEPFPVGVMKASPDLLLRIVEPPPPRPPRPDGAA